MRLLYDILIFLLVTITRLVALFNKRADLLTRGHREAWAKLSNVDWSGDVIWVHCASLGEFEQGRPLIEAIRNVKPKCKIVLTFFSPSGYEVRRNYSPADAVVYLPPDTKLNARRFIREVKPTVVFFVKYEYWYNYFNELKRAGVPLYMVSAIFREGQVFFKYWGGWFRKILGLVTTFYVQDEKSCQLLNEAGFTNVLVAGDTRFDRVATVASQAVEIPMAKEFSNDAKVLVAGSTWPQDEEILARYIKQASTGIKLIVAPHHVDAPNVQRLVKMFDVPVVCYSSITGKISPDTRVLVIDTIGLLSSIYRYGTVAYLGGGFGKGIHNTLEAATYNIPVIFGPNYTRFKEAVDLINVSGGFSINNYSDFNELMNKLLDDRSSSRLNEAGISAGNYVKSRQGATSFILKDIGWS